MAIIPSITGPSKGSLVQRAYEQLGQFDYDNQIEPEEYATGIRLLEDLMSEWSGQGINIGYNFSPSLNGNDALQTLSGISAANVSVVTGYLALALAPTIGKQVQPEVRTRLARSWALLKAKAAVIPTVQNRDTTPIGAGNRYWPGVVYFTNDVDDPPDDSTS